MKSVEKNMLGDEIEVKLIPDTCTCFTPSYEEYVIFKQKNSCYCGFRLKHFHCTACGGIKKI